MVLLDEDVVSDVVFARFKTCVYWETCFKAFPYFHDMQKYMHKHPCFVSYAYMKLFYQALTISSKTMDEKGPIR